MGPIAWAVEAFLAYGTTAFVAVCCGYFMLACASAWAFEKIHDRVVRP